MTVLPNHWQSALVLPRHDGSKRDRRKYSDPVRLRSAHDVFVRHWNGETAPTRVNPICVLRARSSNATDFEEVRKVNWAFASPRKSRLSTLMIDPELAKLRYKYERKIERRKSLSAANSSLAADKANPMRSVVMDKYERVLTLGRRCLSETTLLRYSEAEIDVDLFGVRHHKRVSFSAPAIKRKSVCVDGRPPASILLKESKVQEPEYPLTHMDYATFQAWRNGETFRQSVDSADDSEGKQKAADSVLQILKYVIFSCLKR